MRTRSGPLWPPPSEMVPCEAASAGHLDARTKRAPHTFTDEHSLAKWWQHIFGLYTNLGLVTEEQRARSSRRLTLGTRWGHMAIEVREQRCVGMAEALGRHLGGTPLASMRVALVWTQPCAVSRGDVQFRWCTWLVDGTGSWGGTDHVGRVKTQCSDSIHSVAARCSAFLLGSSCFRRTSASRARRGQWSGWHPGFLADGGAFMS